MVLNHIIIIENIECFASNNNMCTRLIYLYKNQIMHKFYYTKLTLSIKCLSLERNNSEFDANAIIGNTLFNTWLILFYWGR